jgi:hypothetical protein
MSEQLIDQSPSPVPATCGCGVRIPTGGTVYRISTDASSSRALFDGQVFCSPGCIRQFLLESLETLDALDTPASRLVVTDLHELYQGVAETYAAVLGSPH